MRAKSSNHNRVRLLRGSRDVPAWRLRTCPKCGAAPGQSCRREINAKVQGKETGGGYTVRLKGPHAERKADPQPEEEAT